MKTIYSTFRTLHEDGITAPGTQEEMGPTWTGFFPQGNIGIMPMPASLQGMANDNLKDEDIGVTQIAGINGGQSTFVGGDSIGISRDSKVADQAWNFLSWMLDDEAQVEVVAKGGNVVARTDLADNEYSSADPRLVLFNTVAGVGADPVRAQLRADVQRPAGPVARAALRRALRRREPHRRRQRRDQRLASAIEADAGPPLAGRRAGAGSLPPALTGITSGLRFHLR